MTEATPAQQGVWFTEQAGIAGTSYHLAVRLRFDEGVDEGALLAACADVASRHPALGSVVAVHDGVPHLRPGPVPPVLRATLPDDPAEEVRRPIDLVRGPLARFVVDTGGSGAELLFVAHHLVFDGTSKDVLVADLAAAYAARRGATRPDGVTPDGVTPDGATAPGEALSGEALPGVAPDDDAVALAAAREYWATNPLPEGGVVLPGLDRVPDAAEPGVALPATLGPETSSALDAVAARLGASRFEVLFAALNAVLFRYGNPAPVVATDLSTRGPADAGRIGLFVNELPVGPAAPEAFEGSFAGLVTALRARLREVYRVRTVPLGRAVLGLRARTAMAPVSLSYRRRAADPRFDGTGTTVDWSVFPGAVGNALHLQVVDDGSSLELSLRHSPAALPTDAARRVLAHLRTLLDAALAAPDTAVPALPLLPPDERDLVVTRWNETGRAWPAGATLPGLFAEQALRTPQAVAVTGPALGSGAAERSLSYGELSAAVAALAEELRARGVGRGDLVAVCLPRSVDLVVALLAVAATSAAYVPVDPAHPERRQAQILAEAAPRLVVTTAQRAAQLGDAVPTLVPDAVREAGDRTPAAGRSVTDDALGAAGPGPDDLAYVMFTSGSTGRPKGVRVPHRALANLLLGMREVLADPGADPGAAPGADPGAGPAPAGASPEGEVWLALTSVGFDISALELFVPLTTGGRVVVVPDGLAADGTAVTALIHRHGVTHVQATPSGWRVLLAGGLGQAPGRRVLALAGGEALGLPLARELRARVRRLVNVYGPTETTIWSTSAELPEQVDRVTIGRPIANTRAYLLDAAGSPVPVGVPGDLYLGGDGVADGYLDRPELTAAAFGTDPFVPGGTVYRTGDRARHLPDGRLEFLGRADTQVKIRGHRVELGEIEARLLEHPGLAAAAVVLHREGADDGAEGPDDDPFLAAYLVPRAPGDGPRPEELRELLAGWLPAAALPRAWTVLDALPLTPHGKLDRAALPAPPRRPAEPPAARDVPSDKIAEQLRDIWCEVLRIDDIALDEDLFDLGGHSLTITRIIGRIEQHWGVTVPFDDFFDEPTCLGVAVAVRRELRGLADEEGDA